MLTIGEVRREAIDRLREHSLTPALDADLLLSKALDCDRAYLLAHGQQALTGAQAAQFSSWLERAAAGEPIAYIVGSRGFYDLDFEVNPSVLIPRPETELLLELALAWAQAREMVTAFDVGTGSGALAVTFAVHVPQAKVVAVDISAAALDTARRNAARWGVSNRITFLEGDLLKPCKERRLQADVIMANLPYIERGELARLAVSRYEPRLALDGGEDGLELMRRLIAQTPDVCAHDSLVLLEIGAEQGAAVREMVKAVGAQRVDVLPDYAGLDRIVRFTL